MPKKRLSLPIDRHEPPPFWGMKDDDFEELCRVLLLTEPGVEKVELFRRHQRQLGVDLKADLSPGDGIFVAQCKSEREFGPTKIKQAADEFLKYIEYWIDRGTRRFYLMVACDLSSSSKDDEIERQKKQFREHGIEFKPWSWRTLKDKLSSRPDLVRRFLLLEEWVQLICGVQTPTYTIELGAREGGLVAVGALAYPAFGELAARLAVRGESRPAWRGWF